MNGKKPIANPQVVLREEFDDWAVLFNPDTGNGFGLNPTGVYLWKLMDGEHLLGDLLTALRREAIDVPEEAHEHIAAFVEELATRGLVGYQIEQVQVDIDSPIHPACRSGARLDRPLDVCQGECGRPRYEPPCLETFHLEGRALGNCANGSHDMTGRCSAGNGAGCGTGSCVGYACQTGTVPGFCCCNSGSNLYPSRNGCYTGGCDYVPVCLSGTGPS